MKELLIYIRNKIFHILYIFFLRKIFFLFDAESAHNSIIRIGGFLGRFVSGRKITSLAFSYSNEKLEQNILGINFKNPVGLAGGFDKNGELTEIMPSVGFGFTEIGSITEHALLGNPKPRLWRLKKSKAIVVNYGLANQGAEKILQRIKNKENIIPIGINIAASYDNPEKEIKDYIESYCAVLKKFNGISDYFTINISCPNIINDKMFANYSNLDNLLSEIKKITDKPVFLKISPDLEKWEIDQIIEASEKYGIKGFICSNLTKNRNNSGIIDKKIPESGGISGKPLADLSDELIKYIYQRTKGRFIIIGCGGIFSAEDAYKKIKLGASLVQIITGMIFEGPQLIGEINQGLARLLEKDGFENISQAVGKDNPLI